MTRTIAFLTVCCATALAAMPVRAHVGEHPSVHDTIAGMVERLRREQGPQELVDLTPETAVAAMTEEERHILGSQYITFTLSTPAVVSVLCEVRTEQPFWLAERGFTRSGLRVEAGGDRFTAWQKTFDAGPVGLGIPSLSGGPAHFFVAIAPVDEGEIAVSEVYPAFHTTGRFVEGEKVYSDDDDALEEIAPELSGQLLLRGADDQQGVAQVVDFYRMTPYPSSPTPDHIVLTWSEDPKHTQTIQWRTNTETLKGAVAYQKKSTYMNFDRTIPLVAQARTEPMETPDVVNDPVVLRHTVVLRDLEPATTYVYAVGTGAPGEWSELAEFTTAPEGDEPFSFVYMGDSQNGLERWGSLIQKSHRDQPHAAFYVMAGDLVNRGAERDDWDTYFENAVGVYSNKPIVPAIGNHEYHGGEPELYLEHFTLPLNGPETLRAEKAYSFEYSNALFVILDTNKSPESQAEWLDEQLAGSDKTWKFAVYHHPAYSSAPNRNNASVRNSWGSLFDAYHVDMALQGHDHAYLRTYPMKDGQPVESAAEGTIYIVSVSGTKFYEQGDFDYKEFGMTNTSTYQVLDIQISGDRLVYRAYDLEGELRDQVVIEK